MTYVCLYLLVLRGLVFNISKTKHGLSLEVTLMIFPIKCDKFKSSLIFPAFFFSFYLLCMDTWLSFIVVRLSNPFFFYLRLYLFYKLLTDFFYLDMSFSVKFLKKVMRFLRTIWNTWQISNSDFKMWVTH